MAEETETMSSHTHQPPPPSSSESTTTTSTQKSQSEGIPTQSQVPVFSGFPASPNGDFQMFPVMYPALVPGLNTLQNQEQINRGAGIYAVPVFPYMVPVAGLPLNTLIPLTYNIPTVLILMKHGYGYGIYEDTRYWFIGREPGFFWPKHE